MPMGKCRNCKKYAMLDSDGYCNSSSCEAEMSGEAFADNLLDSIENLASKYMPREVFRGILGAIVLAVVYFYFFT